MNTQQGLSELKKEAQELGLLGGWLHKLVGPAIL